MKRHGFFCAISLRMGRRRTEEGELAIHRYAHHKGAEVYAGTGQFTLRSAASLTSSRSVARRSLRCLSTGFGTCYNKLIDVHLRFGRACESAWRWVVQLVTNCGTCRWPPTEVSCGFDRLADAQRADD